MLIERISFAHLVDSGVRLSWREAVAITRRTAALCAQAAPGQPGGDLLADMELDARGTVSVATAHSPAIAVSELALFLMQMLPAETAPADRRAPVTVDLAIGRALGLDDAPPFDSVAEFADALARTEQNWPATPTSARPCHARHRSRPGRPNASRRHPPPAALSWRQKDKW